METTAIEMFQTSIHYTGDNVWVKPVCDFFEIDYTNQVRNIKNDPFLAFHSGKKSDESLFGDNYHRIYVDKIGLLAWIVAINPNTVPEEKREVFFRYRDLIAEYIFGNQTERVKSHERLKVLYSERERIKREISKERKRLFDLADPQYFEKELQRRRIEQKKRDSKKQLPGQIAIGEPVDDNTNINELHE